LVPPAHKREEGRVSLRRSREEARGSKRGIHRTWTEFRTWRGVKYGGAFEYEFTEEEG
jgi:hypothetical protein